MDDFLYIILGIAWLAWSLYSNKQKMDKKRAETAERTRDQKQVNVPPPYTTHEAPRPAREYQPVPERNVFEEIFGEFIPVEPEARQEEYIPEVDERTWQRKMESYGRSEAQSLEEIREEVPADYFNKKYVSQYKAVEQQVTDLSEIGSEEPESTDSVDEFDLKKAVIYREILRAPYISESR